MVGLKDAVKKYARLSSRYSRLSENEKIELENEIGEQTEEEERIEKTGEIKSETARMLDKEMASQIYLITAILSAIITIILMFL